MKSYKMNDRFAKNIIYVIYGGGTKDFDSYLPKAV